MERAAIFYAEAMHVRPAQVIDVLDRNTSSQVHPKLGCGAKNQLRLLIFIFLVHLFIFGLLHPGATLHQALSPVNPNSTT